ncbi:ABC transporter permease [Haliangium ochraceum]|uniref:Uncharacterized protein n=1 Tax=Haliangium ochraceum (strain DSM 14365 / JCM 11303 / SMP-2) TaxID=502025 RepID=D0LHU8_HALO1|nr:ABC transporter permease [Haliangium ochraceum]ACY14777.1 hypothetical protein Hoch_2234 [Haliangium ochraceum DSM 14365]
MSAGPGEVGHADQATAGTAGTADAIYQLGYERYRGPRRERGSRAWIIARNVVAQAWQSRWGVKAPLVLTAMWLMGASVAMWFLRHELVDMARQAAGDKIAIPGPEIALYVSTQAFAFFAFVIATVVGCRAVADDLRLGSFQFYFSRPLRVFDYGIGKLLGVGIAVGLPMLAAPLCLAVVRLLFARDLGDAWAHADVLPRSLATGLVGTLSLTVIPVALGAVVGHRRWAQAGFAIYYLVIASILEQFALQFDQPLLALLSIDANLTSVGVALYDAPMPPDAVLPPPLLSALVVVLLLALGSALIAWRVRRAESSFLGGRL